MRRLLNFEDREDEISAAEFGTRPEFMFAAQCGRWTGSGRWHEWQEVIDSHFKVQCKKRRILNGATE